VSGPAVESPARLLSDLECSVRLVEMGHSPAAVIRKTRSVLADLATLRSLDPLEAFHLAELCVEDCGRRRDPAPSHGGRRPERCAECRAQHKRRQALKRQHRHRGKLGYPNSAAVPTSPHPRDSAVPAAPMAA
jgi:hypothetical protein